MPREFVLTRSLFVLGAVALAVAAFLGSGGSDPSPEPVGGVTVTIPERPDGPTWEEELLAPEIQALWMERRLLLESLSRRYRDEHRGPERDSLRREMERLISLSERDVNDLRVRNARRDGHDALAAWLERARERLPAESSVAEGADRLQMGVDR